MDGRDALYGRWRSEWVRHDIRLFLKLQPYERRSCLDDFARDIMKRGPLRWRGNE